MQRFGAVRSWRVVRTGLAAVALLALVAVPAQPAQAKEFDVTGTIDCGVRSGKQCDFTDWSTGPVIGVLTQDISGTRERVLVDASWVKHDLRDFDQDDFVWFTVQPEDNGNYQATGIVEHHCNQGTASLGIINQGKSTSHHCRT
jgi:hypothetical protein